MARIAFLKASCGEEVETSIALESPLKTKEISHEDKSRTKLCNTIETEFDWTPFEKEPLKSVDLKELKKQRSEQDVRKLATLLIRYQHLLSDGTLPQNDTLKHSTTAIITTTEEYPKIQARGRGCNPNEAKEYAQMIEAKMC